MNRNSFKKHINHIYKEQNEFMINYKKRLIIDNKDNLTCLSVFDIEQYNKLREPRILNDFINVLKDIKKDKKYSFFTITLKNIDYKNMSNDEVMENIKEQYEILKEFQYLIFKKRNDKKNSLSKIDKILKYELTKKYVLHLHTILFYEDINDMKIIYNRIKKYKNSEKFKNIGRFEIVVNDSVFDSFSQLYKFQKKQIDGNECLIDGNFKSGDFNYFKKLDEDENLIKYVYKYLTKNDSVENKIFKLLQIKRQIYSHKFFDGLSQKDLKTLNYYFYKIIKEDYKLINKLESATEELKEEINFKLSLISRKDNVSINIINRIKREKIIIDKKEDKKNLRYFRKMKIDNMSFNIPLFTKLSKKKYVEDHVKYKHTYNFDKYFMNYDYYDKNNIFNLSYKYNFIRDYYFRQYNKPFMFDFETFKKFINTNYDIQKKKIEEYKNLKYKEFYKKGSGLEIFSDIYEIEKYEEIEKLKKSRTTEKECKERLKKELIEFGSVSEIGRQYNLDIQECLTSDFNNLISKMFKVEFDRLSLLFTKDGELKGFNQLEHFIDIDF